MRLAAGDISIDWQPVLLAKTGRKIQRDFQQCIEMLISNTLYGQWVHTTIQISLLPNVLISLVEN